VNWLGVMWDELVKGVGYSAFGFFAGYYVCKFRRSVEKIEEAVVSEHEAGKAGTEGREGTGDRGGQGGPGGTGGTGGMGTPDGTGGQGGTGGPGGTGGSGGRGTFSGRHGGWQGRTLGVIVLIMTLVTVVSNLYTNSQTRSNSEHDRRVTACQAEYNRDFAKAVTIRGQYADEDRAELYKMITTVISGKTQEIRTKAITDWVAATERNNKLREATPLPNLETRNCDDQ
jgi:hypothetical protein